MPGVKIPCPKCEAVLKLPDEKLLGKKGKCPKCGHKFVLAVPSKEEEPVVVEVVEPEPPAQGLNPTWIPDSPSQTEAPFSSLLEQSAPATSNDENPLGFLSDAEAPAQEGFSLDSPATPVPATDSPIPEENKQPEPHLIRSRRKRRKKNSSSLIVAAVMLIVAGGAGFLIYQQMQPGSKGLIRITEQSPVPDQATPQPVAAPKNLPKSAQYDPIKEKSPTSGRKIQLFHLPAGVRIAVNLRPAEIWSSDRKLAEFRGALGPLGTWLESSIEEYTRQKPEQIEELLVGILLGAKGTPAEYAAVVHFKEPQQRSTLLDIYGGTPYKEFNTNIQLTNGVAYQLIDDKTVSICPESYVEDVLSFAKSPAVTATQIEEILDATDRDRLVTVVCDRFDLEAHYESLFPESAHVSIEKAIRWVGEDATSVAWSVHLADDFYTDLTIMGDTTAKPSTLRSLYSDRLNALPELLLSTVRKMNPPRSGYRQLIGRFPAMLKVLSMTASVVSDDRFVQIGTLLPAKAGPNLALGTLLTWDESTRTDFTVAVVQPKKEEPKLGTFQERLQKKMDVDFRRTPLQEAFALISEECKIPIEIDGDALKLAGFTKNMPQSHQEQGLTTLQAIYTIVKKYEQEKSPIVVHLDEKGNKILVLTKPVAATMNLDTYDFSKLPPK